MRVIKGDKYNKRNAYKDIYLESKRKIVRVEILSYLSLSL